MNLGGARNRHDPWLLCKHPGQSHLGTRGFLPVRNFADCIHYLLIGLPGLGAEAWNSASEIVRSKRGLCIDGASKKSFAQRTERNESNAEFLKRGKDLFFRLTPPKRILALQCRD